MSRTVTKKWVYVAGIYKSSVVSADGLPLEQESCQIHTDCGQLSSDMFARQNSANDRK